jgi:PKD domain-containing protein
VCPSGAPTWTRLVDGYNRLSYGVETVDGYFKNVDGKPGPTASFTISPPIPEQGATVTLNATKSFDPDNQSVQNAGILRYLWDFGDSSGTANITVSVPIATHVFSRGGNVFLGNFSIRLTVVDQDDNFQAMKATLLTIVPPPTHCVAVQGIQTNVNQVKPGTSVPFTVEIQDTGTFQEAFNLTIAYGPPNATLAVILNQSIKPNQIRHYNSTLSTSNLPVGIYSITATVQLAAGKNCSEGLNTSQLGIAPNDTTTLLLQIVGGAVGVAVIGVVIGFLRRRRNLKIEPL